MRPPANEDEQRNEPNSTKQRALENCKGARPCLSFGEAVGAVFWAMGGAPLLDGSRFSVGKARLVSPCRPSGELAGALFSGCHEQPTQIICTASKFFTGFRAADVQTTSARAMRRADTNEANWKTCKQALSGFARSRADPLHLGRASLSRVEGLTCVRVAAVAPKTYSFAICGAEASEKTRDLLQSLNVQLGGGRPR